MIASNKTPPHHVALIMDGNGRWATRMGKKRTEGHSQGLKHLNSIFDTCFNFGVSYLTLFGFSTENWNRPKSEIGGIFSLLVKSIESELKTFTDLNLKFVHLGNKQTLPTSVRTALIRLESATNFPDCKGTLALAFNYGSHEEIIKAAKVLVTKYGDPSCITIHELNECLYTRNIPDVDMLIRTGGEKRLSNFLLFQSTKSKFVSTDILWPDFTGDDMKSILDSY